MSVIHLTSKDFILKNGNVYINNTSTPGILLIHANWCHHCVEFKKTYDELAKKLGNQFVCVAIENDEIQKKEGLSNALDFRYFPTLKFFDKNGKIIETYPDQPRTLSNLLNYICKFFHACVFSSK